MRTEYGRRAARLCLAWALLAILAGLTWGALRQRQAFLQRGIPPGLPEPIAHAGARWGVKVYLERYAAGELDQTLQDIANAGIPFIQQSFYYGEAFDWATADRWLAAATAHGLTLVPLLDGDPAAQFAPPADPNTFAAWAGAFAQRYGAQIDYYIIWDEPNLAAHWGQMQVNPDAYAALLTTTAAAIRSADSQANLILAPLAPTVETNSINLADPLYLQAVYEAGAAAAFDVVAAKPYGFDTGPDDRRVALDTLNFSRIVLLREVMLRNGDGDKALWAGNWGWNALPADWAGQPSIWGQTDEATRLRWTLDAFQRARREWPWLGMLFLENWEPAAPSDDPRWGFSLAGRSLVAAIAAAAPAPEVAYPGFHLAAPDDPAQHYVGGWRFSAEFGADSSQVPPGAPRDKVTFRFWGTDLGLRVRRADFRARFYVTIDSKPANALPRDENGAMLVLDAPDPREDYIATEWVARNLPPGEHTAVIEADRGWDQWALHGFSVAYHPSDVAGRWAVWLSGLTAGLGVLLAARAARSAEWRWLIALAQRLRALSDGAQLRLIALLAALVAAGGWLTWGSQAAGLYRRLGDHTQLALTATLASIYYVTPFFFVYALALLALILLLSLRPAWGLMLVAATLPFYTAGSSLKPVLGYRFSAVEVFTLATACAAALRLIWHLAQRGQTLQATDPPSGWTGWTGRLTSADWAVVAFTAAATMSLFFTARLDVALNEWRIIIFEPALFYLLLRCLRLSEEEMLRVLDAFVLSGVAVALIGLVKYSLGADVITAEGGLWRLRATYGSPNNVALYLGRVLPFLVGMVIFGRNHPTLRRRLYAAALIPCALAFVLTFSKGGLLLGLPTALAILFTLWQHQHGRRAWPWLIGLGLLGAAGLIALLRIPQLAGRLSLGATGVIRINLWRASLEMIREHPLWGVGLDNFLYAYRGRYIFNAAWADPNLNHPHNLFLDLTARLGLIGLIAGLALFGQLLRLIWRLPARVPPASLPIAAGLVAACAYALAHGLVDHSFFLVDLAFSFYWLLGLAGWLNQTVAPGRRGARYLR